MSEPDGVWVVYSWDMGVHIEAIYATAEEAVREHGRTTYLQIGHVPFGAEVPKALGYP